MKLMKLEEAEGCTWPEQIVGRRASTAIAKGALQMIFLKISSPKK